MILYTKEFIQEIKKSKKTTILCGASNRSKELINQHNLFKQVDYILDNYSSKKDLYNIPILNFDDIKKIKNKSFFICGNHELEFIKQLKKYEIFIEFSKSTLEILPKNFFFELEVADFQGNHGFETCHFFVPKIINELLRYNQKIVTVPTKHTNESYFKKREIKENSLIFSYHSFATSDLKKVHYKEGYFFDLINIDAMGYSGWSSLCSDEKEIEKIKQIDIKKAEKDFLYYKAKYIDKNRSKYEQPDIDDVLFPKEFVFIPLQIFTDSVMAKSYFEPMEWFRKTVEFLTKKNINIVIKRHPRCYLKEVEAELEKLKNQKNITIYSGSIHQAISKCSAVYTINSGSGFEALFHLKPVVTFGEVDYQSATFNIKDFKELEANPIPVLSEEKIIYIKQFLSYYMREKNININSKKSIEKFVDSFVLRYLNSLLKDNKI